MFYCRFLFEMRLLNLKIEQILKRVDHTLLNPSCTWDEIKEICDDGVKFSTASVCLPPAFVKRAKEYVNEAVKICTVIGFPNGYATTNAKVFETIDAIKNGADEIDMVINIGELKAKNFNYIENEITKIRSACNDKVLKVIIETCLLNREEKMQMCKIISDCKADYIKTSTGFSNWGATKEDIELLSKNISGNVKIKAAGGIKTLQDASDFINLGCDRLGTSQVVKIIKGEKKSTGDEY